MEGVVATGRGNLGDGSLLPSLSLPQVAMFHGNLNDLSESLYQNARIRKTSVIYLTHR